ncbi:hypothetical protein ANCDUO_08365 [Ancylostoma duodenale]|uniref:Uncharacterized protein n=1 Tax=Ancylostoma duodenale TaxID=51022 RepID=A0A0C2CWR6_9BILA|nr:hypothetical protein ANCDUO_08365 [Ancylostoma duodenale]
MEVAAAVAEPWRRRVSSVSLDNSSVSSDLPVSPRSPNSSLGCLCEVDELDSDDPSENTSDGGASSLHVRRRTVTQDRLTPDANYNFRKKCPTPTSPSVGVLQNLSHFLVSFYVWEFPDLSEAVFPGT